MRRDREDAAESRRVIREWLAALPQETGLSLTRIATELGLAPSTLTNPVNRDYPHVTSAKTLLRIARHFGVPLPQTLDIAGGPPRARALREEAAPFAFDATPDFNALVHGYIGGRPGVDAWTLRTAALDLAGYLPGDVVILDLNAAWRPGGIVCANYWAPRSGSPMTVWRLYRPPFLLARSSDPALIEPINEADVDRHGAVLLALRRPPDAGLDSLGE